MSIGKRIRERRKALNMTQTQLAEMIGVSKGAVANYESDANAPKIPVMERLLSALKCDANYLCQDIISGMDDKEMSELSLFQQLDSIGQDKVIDYTDDLIASGKYRRNTK